MSAVRVETREAVASSRAATATGRLRLAVIGAGVRGAGNGLAVQRAPHARLAVVMDVNEGLARRTAGSLGVPWTTDYDAVLSDSNVDAVFINTPHHMHAPQAIKAARAGKHVIVEKPLATTVADAARMVRVAAEEGVQLAPWLGFRYFPAVMKAAQLVRTGLLGTVLGAHLVLHNYKPPAYFKGGSSGAGTEWRAKWETSGGGILIMTGIHYLDWLLYLSGLEVREVSARYATLNSPAEVEDAIVMWLVMDNGALATVDMASCVHGGSPIIELRIWGTEGHLSLTPPFQVYASRQVDGLRPERWNRLEHLPRLRDENVSVGMAIEYVERFADAVLARKPLDITGRDGLALQAVIEAAYASSRQAQPVAVSYPEL